MTIPTNGSIYSLTASYMCKLCRNDSSACVKFEMGNVLLCEPLHIEYIGHNITANISSFMDKRLHHNGSFMPCKLWVFCSPLTSCLGDPYHLLLHFTISIFIYEWFLSKSHNVLIYLLLPSIFPRCKTK